VLVGVRHPDEVRAAAAWAERPLPAALTAELAVAV
jgi:hypothetical protein